MRSLRSYLANFGFALALLAFVAVGAVAYISANKLATTQQGVADAQRVLEAIGSVYSDISDIDHNSTSYALTGAEGFLGPYELAMQQKDANIALVRQVTASDANEQATVEQLVPVIVRRSALATQAVRVRKEQGADAAKALLTNGEQNRLMDQIQTLVNQLRLYAAKRLKGNQEDAKSSAGLTPSIILGGTAGGIGLFSFVVFLLKRDVGARRKVEEGLAAEHQLVRELSDNIPDAIYVKDAKGRFILTNKTQRKLLTGDESALVEGKTVYDFLAPHYAELQDRDDQAVVRARRAFVDRIEPGATKEGEPQRWYSSTKVPIFTEAGELKELLGITRDVTELKKMQDELQTARETVETAKRAKTDFLANISHELRTPMNGIIGMTEMALDTELTDQQREYLTLVQNSAQSLRDLMNDLMDFSKGEISPMELDKVAFDLNDLLDEIIKPLGHRASQKRISLTYRISDAVPRYLRGDPSRLRQVLVNLIGNAIKFTDQGEIALELKPESASRDQTTIQFNIRDTGIGIPESKREAIFEAFVQADTSSTRNFGGTGLGLTISSRLVKAMGGRIWLDSKVDIGSTFYFTAVFGISEEPVRKRKPAVDTRPLEGSRVLVVDHDYTSRRMIEEMLASWKVNATVVTSGPAALDEIWQAFQDGMPIPTVIIEATMPGMDGFELGRLIKKEAELAGTRLILMSTLPEKANLANARELGFDEALSKPIRPSDLLEALMRVCVRQQPAEATISLGIPTAADTQGYEEEEDFGAEGERADRILKILIAEDNPVNQAVAAGVLRKRGHKILLANNGAEAVRFFEHEPVDIVLMDLQMPEMDGFTAVKNIRRIETGTGNHVPIVAVTAHAMKGDRERCLASGMDAYLAKPFPKEELVRLVESMALQTSSVASTGNTGWAAVPQSAPRNKAALSSKEQLISDLGDDEDLLKTLIQLFLDSTPKLLGELDAALLARNAGALERAAHSLKSSVGNFGAKHAMQLAQAIEFAGKNGELNEASEKVSELHDEMRRVMAALQEML